MSSEADLIKRYLHCGPWRTDVVKGIGDDAAVVHVPEGNELAISADTLVAGVHFPANTDPADLGHKALAVNLSDLAAIGAQPTWAMLALTLPSADEVWLAAFSTGLLALASAHRVQLIGGDLTRGPLSITLQAMGFLPCGKALYRAGARPGDIIFVTGSIGDAGLGLALMQGERKINLTSSAYCMSRLNRPTPRVSAGLALRGLASAVIDVSDGLAVDLERLLIASNVGATVELTRIPLSAAVRAAFAQTVDWRLVLTAGDDYELLFTVPAAQARELARRTRTLDCCLTQIGYIESVLGLRYVLDGEALELTAPLGYDHFARA